MSAATLTVKTRCVVLVLGHKATAEGRRGFQSTVGHHAKPSRRGATIEPSPHHRPSYACRRDHPSPRRATSRPQSDRHHSQLAACRELFSGIDSFVMNAAQALKLEIERTPEPLLQEVYDFLVFLKTRPNGLDRPVAAMSGDAISVASPDFLARQKRIFGGRTVPDSQAILDDLRADRA